MKATKGGDFKPVALPEPQTALARCYSVIDIGTVPNIYNGKIDPKKKTVKKIQITWEFPMLKAVFHEGKGEEPFVIGLEVNSSTGDNSNLGKLIAQWRNRPLSPVEQEGFDPTTMVGKPAFILFNHSRKKKYRGLEVPQITNENTILKFVAITPKPKDIVCPDMINPPMIWDWELVEKDGFEKHKSTFEKMPKWLQIKCADSLEFKRFSGNYKVEGTEDVQAEGQAQVSAGVQPNRPTVEDNW